MGHLGPKRQLNVDSARRIFHFDNFCRKFDRNLENGF